MQSFPPIWFLLLVYTQTSCFSALKNSAQYYGISALFSFSKWAKYCRGHCYDPSSQ